MLLYVVIGLGVLTVGIFAAAFLLPSQDGAGSSLERLDQYVGTSNEAAESSKPVETSSTTSALTETLDRAIEERGWGGGIATDLARADLKLTVAEFMGLTLISMMGTAAVAWVVYGGFILPLIGLAGGYFVPKIYVKMRQSGRLKKFNDQLGDSITLMANGLRAGYSMLQAMDAVGREMPEPISTEFRRAVQEIGLGVENERAFANLLRRMPSDDLDLLITAINVQQEVGGNLAEILEIIAFVIRERIRIKGQIQVLTAQGQISGWVISLLPIVLGLLLFAMNQEYIGRMVYSCEQRELTGPDDLCSQPCGWIMLGTGFLMIGSGFYAIQKLIEIEV